MDQNVKTRKTLEKIQWISTEKDLKKESKNFMKSSHEKKVVSSQLE